ncbi:hypothetical protein HK097_003899, partial [Rhizophlyctis rosea]
ISAASSTESRPSPNNNPTQTTSDAPHTAAITSLNPNHVQERGHTRIRLPQGNNKILLTIAGFIILFILYFALQSIIDTIGPSSPSPPPNPTAPTSTLAEPSPRATSSTSNAALDKEQLAMKYSNGLKLIAGFLLIVISGVIGALCWTLKHGVEEREQERVRMERFPPAT